MPTVPTIVLSDRQTKAFWRNVAKNDGCWMWGARLDQTGYGRVYIRARGHRFSVAAHRLAYMLLVGDIPHGLELDHLCRVRSCVRPDHLEPVTHYENDRRGAHPNAIAHRTGICRRGHEISGANAYRRKDGRKQCWQCIALRRGWKPAPEEHQFAQIAKQLKLPNEREAA